jgi:hypothetical protein
MSVNMLTIEGLTFPKFHKNSSKRNFRLIFYIAYKDADGKSKTTIVTKPDEGQWQWKKPNNDFYIPENELDDAVELDVSVLHADLQGFSETDYQIAEIDGAIISVAVQFMDVFDASIGDFLRNVVLTKVLEEFKKTGFNPVDLIPVPGIVTGLIKENVPVDKLMTKLGDIVAKETKDKLLHRVSKKYSGETPFVLRDVRKGDEKDKNGPYGVTIGFE